MILNGVKINKLHMKVILLSNKIQIDADKHTGSFSKYAE